MAALKTPGLHLRGLESDRAVSPESAVTAFVGVAERGPLDSPQAIHNWGEYVDVFGGPWGFGVMAQSVYAFFQNGGTSAYAVRVGRRLPAAPLSPCVTQEDLGTAGNTFPIVEASPGASETLRLKARSPGRWGNRLSASIQSDAPRKLELGKLAAPGVLGTSEIQVGFVHDFHVGAELRLVHRDNAFVSSSHLVTVIDEALKRLTIDPPLQRDYPPGSVVFGPGFTLEVKDGRRREVFERLSMNPEHPRHFAEVINGLPGLADLDAARLGHSLLVRAEQVLGPGGIPRFKPVFGPTPGFGGGGDGLTFAQATLQDAAAQPALNFVARLRGRAGNLLGVKAMPFKGRVALAVPEVPGGPKDRLVMEDIRGWVPGDTLRISHAALTDTATIASVHEASHLVVLGGALTNDYPLFSQVEIKDRFNLHVEWPEHPEAAESFFNLSIVAGEPRLCESIVNGGADRSKLVCIHLAPTATDPPLGEVSLSGATDPAEMEIRRYTGYLEDGSPFLPAGPDHDPVGLAALERVPEINLVCIPDVAALPGLPLQDLLLAHRQLLHHCQKMGERFALLDPPPTMSPEAVLEWPAQLQDGKLSRFGAAYFPWLSVVVEDQTRLLPPSGVVAGLIAQADAREGVSRAPANLTCKGVMGLERELDSAEQGELNVHGVNCFRKFEDGAIRLYGARSLSTEAVHLYVHNRRVVSAVVKALSRNLLWAVFEPNDHLLQRRVRDSLEGYFQGLLARGLTAGSKPGEAYYVKVNQELNSATTRDAGELLAEVGIALSQPAEFIVITVKRRPEITALVEEET